MTDLVDLDRPVPEPATGPDPTPDHTRAAGRVTGRQVALRRGVGALVVLLPVLWALQRAVPLGGDIVNRGGVPLIGALLGQASSPRLDGAFLQVVLDATITTLAFAALGTAGALVIGLLGGLVLSDVAWSRRPPRPLRLVRAALRAVLVAIRSIHELVWALLLVSVLGLDPLVAVLAIALPFGAQTAQVFGDTFDSLPTRALRSLRDAGAPAAPAVAFALLPPAGPLLLSYSFYRFECAVRSTVLLGAVGVGGLGQELVVSLSSRNWNEVWSLVAAVIVLSALVDVWSGRLRADMAVASCSEWSAGTSAQAADTGARGSRSRWARGSAIVLVPGIVLAWVASGVSLSGLTSDRTRMLASGLLDDLLPPALPRGGVGAVTTAVLDTVSMAVLAMAIAVLITVVVSPWAVAARRGVGPPGPLPWRAARWISWLVARIVLLVLRSVPPTVWAVIALLALFPGVLPGALALGVYTGGVLGRLVAESWESVSPAPREALVRTGVPGPVASLAAVVPASAQQLVTYTLYRFEICVRETAVVGIVGAAGLGRLLAENLNFFRFPVVMTLLIASFAVSIASEVISRRLRGAIRA